MTQLDTLPADGGFYISSDADLAKVRQAVADYENRLAGGDLGCGPAEPAPLGLAGMRVDVDEVAEERQVLSSQQLRGLAQVREAEERAERGEEPPIAWCGLGHDKYEADLEAARRQMELRQQAGADFDPTGETLGEMFGDEAWEAIKEAARHLREHWQRGYEAGLEAGRAEALAEQQKPVTQNLVGWRRVLPSSPPPALFALRRTKRHPGRTGCAPGTLTAWQGGNRPYRSCMRRFGTAQQ